MTTKEIEHRTAAGLRFRIRITAKPEGYVARVWQWDGFSTWKASCTTLRDTIVPPAAFFNRSPETTNYRALLLADVTDALGTAALADPDRPVPTVSISANLLALSKDIEVEVDDMADWTDARIVDDPEAVPH